MSRDAATPGEDFKIAAAGPAATLLFVLVCLGSTSRSSAPTAWSMPLSSTATVQDHAGAAVAQLAAVLERAAAGVQPDPGVPARRRPDRARDRVAGHRRQASAGPGSPRSWARGSRCCSRAFADVAAARLPELHRAVAGRDRVPARAVRPRGAGADGAQRADRGRHASPTSWTPSRWRSRPSPRSARRSTSTSCATDGLVPGDRRDRPSARHRPPGAAPGGRGRRRGLADGRRRASTPRTASSWRIDERPPDHRGAVVGVARARSAR